MTIKETLSDKISSYDGEPLLLSVDDVKEFIKKLKEIEIWNCSPDEYLDKLNQLAGKELIEEKEK